MGEKLKLIMVQPDIIWQQISGNFDKYEQLLATAGSASLIILPEMFATGFIPDPEPFARQQNMVLEWMKNIAFKKESTILGSHPFHEKGLFYNRLICVAPDGNVNYYDKRHLFAYGGENIRYTAGKKRTLLEIDGWKVLPLICYDLRFPVWSRNTENYELLVYSANWPAERKEIWTSLLKARAIENQCYVAGVNRTGIDGQGINYAGQSMLISPLGDILASMKEEEGILNFILEKKTLSDFREKYPFLDDRDDFRFV